MAAATEGEAQMRINVTSVPVNDQEKALRFYTEVLGFEKKTDIPLGDTKWLTVVSPDARDGVERLLEPATHPAIGPFRDALVADGIPYTSFAVDDVPSGIRAADAPWRDLRPAADGHGPRHHRGVRRYVRQPDPDCG
jgi:catechol 2,3-dioxygenase-like lactoylglutathione lyase family enzyme